MSPCPMSFLVVESISNFTLKLTYPITWNKLSTVEGKKEVLYCCLHCSGQQKL